jgi:4-amino-4-deoxychorismate lyase
LFDEVHNFQERSQISKTQPLKIRVDVNAEGKFDTTITEVSSTIIDQLYPTKLPDPTALSLVTLANKYDVVMDWIATPISTYTWLKTARREHYDAARKRMLNALSETQDGKASSRANCEILLHNTRNEVTEGSVSNIYLWRDGWITPPAGSESGGLEGVARRWAIESGLCKRIENVSIESVHDGEIVWISNGVRGFQSGVIRVIKP